VKDEAEAAGYFKHVDRQFHDGLYFEAGRGVVKDEAGAPEYYELTADQNDADAEYGYVVCLAKGRGVLKDEVEAARYYKHAADQHHVDQPLDSGLSI
jgi:TPR repeat protein